ncbi:MAG: AsmA family protein [Hyphomicrobiaceae bacterium]
MNNLLIAIAVFAITILGALFAVPHFIDWNSYRSVFEEEAKNIIGRDVEVDGDVKLYLLPTPYFRVEKVRIADTSTALSEHFFKADSISIKLSIAPLVQGIVEVHEIELQRPVLRLAHDAKGSWNWQSFAQALGSTGYVPANVTLTSLKVVDGTLALHGADGVERARLDGVNGELSAPALQGPYRFRATYMAGGAKREIRLATAAPEDGKVPFRISLRYLDTGASYTLEADAADLMGKPRLEGELTALLPIAAAKRPALALEASETPLEVKSKIRADMAGAAFGDLTLTFEQGNRPQIVTGEAKAVWGAPVEIDLRLKSRWLDLDRLAGGAEGAGPVASVTRLAAWLRDRLPGEGVTTMRVELEQANLAGEAVGQLRLGLARSGDRLKLTELRADLPGGSRGEIKGDISVSTDALAFKGSLGLRGTSTARFVAWASSNGLSVAADADGPFDLRAALAVDAGQAEVSELAGTLAGTLLKGSGRYKWSGRPVLAVMLEGPKLDVRSWLPADTSLFELFGILSGAASARQDEARAPTPGNALLRALQSDLDLQVRAGQLVTAARTYRDFVGAVTMKGGNLKQLRLRLTGDDGSKLQLEGNVDNLGTAPKGMLRGLVATDSAESVVPLAVLLGVPPAFRPGDSRQQAMLPLRLAGALTFGARSPTSADWTIDGEAGGAPVKIGARFDGGPGGWRGGRADVTALVDAADATKLASLLFPGSQLGGKAGSAKSGRVLVRAGGIPSAGLASLVTVDTADVAINFRGQVRLAEAGAKADGDLEVRAGNGTLLATLIGLAPTLRLDSVPVNARLKLALGGGRIGMDKLTLQLGESRLSGKIALSAAGEKRRIDADLHIDDVSVATLLTPLLDLRFGAASAAQAALGQRSPWPDVPFSGAVLDAFEGQIKLSSRRLALMDGMALDRAKVHVVLAPGRIEVKEISGAVLGGQVKATLSIEKAPAGADVRGTLGFGIALEEIAGARPAKATGPVSGTLKFVARGLSPRAVVAALQGEGSIVFDDVKLPGLAPGAVAVAAEAALKAEAGNLGEALRQALAAKLAADSLPVGQATFALEVADGQVRSKSMLIETPEGRAIGSTRLDLNAFKLDSQWRLQPKPPDAGPDAAKRPLPPVIVSYRAPLAALKDAERQIDTTAVEQELSARKIERDLEELERLRRLDQSKSEGKSGEVAPPTAPPGLPGAPVSPAGSELAPDAPG